ncbi:WD repeat-containing protein 55 homolog [Teleopsis dalmanni]|uniref:WD repeat-containing protein 55 homolog n=1 Tax=Teleopsis dalmanni TaxID=139649 RepID=UPI0018CDAD88|nr:WD repeat-containing protein 55 homolog [Teleopsis dalmanni]
MKLGENFRNPSDILSDDEDMDELGDNEENGDFPIPIIPDLNDSDEFEEPDFEGDGYSSISISSTDSLMDDSDEEIEMSKTTTKSVNANENDDSNPRASSSGDAQKSAVLELNGSDEDDETVKAIIAAIKNPRTTPPDINLEDCVTDVCFHPEQNIIAIATVTGDVCLYKLGNEKNTLLRTIEVHAKSCRDVEFSEDGRNLITCSKDKSIMITDMQTERLKKFYESAHDDAINKLHVLDENLFATGDDSGTVKLWDLRTKNAIFALKEVEDYITQILTNDAKKLLLFTSGDGYLTTINIGARKLYVQSEEYQEEFTCMATYRGDSKLVVGTSKGRLYTYNWGQFGYHSDMFPGIDTPINAMIPITDRISCIANEDGHIRACHVAPFRNLGIVGQHSMPVECLDISADGELIASASHNNDVRFWNVKYFEDFGDIKYNEKHNKAKEKRHNLPSSKFSNASDFFADLTKEPTASDE